ELERWATIDKALGLGSPDPSETYSNSPHLYDEMGIPTEAGGTIGTPRKAPAKRREASSGSSERPARRPDRRKRTRGGKPVTGHPEANPAADADTGAENAAAGSGAPTSSTRRRRRRRKPADAAAVTN
ncbi:MAG: ATP-dependent RNA helicase, partial [Mycobacterium sp.]